MKKLFNFLTAAGLCAVFLASCGTQNQNATENAAATEAPKPTAASNNTSNNTVSESTESVQTEFVLYAPHMPTPVNLDGIVTQEVMKQSGINWTEVQMGSGVDTTEQINLKIVSGDFSNIDAFMCPMTDTIWGRIVEEGIMTPLDDYFNDAVNYPNLAKIDKRVIDYWRMADGHIYFVPTGYELVLDKPNAFNMCVDGLRLRRDLVEQSGQTMESIKDLEGFEAFLTYCVGLQDEKGRSIIPLSLGGENFPGIRYALSMFGVAPGYNIADNGDAAPDYTVPGYKEAFRWLNKMHKAGILDPETTYQKHDLYQSKLGGLRYAAHFFNGWDTPNNVVVNEYEVPANKTWTELEKDGFPAEWYFSSPIPKQQGVNRAPFTFYNPFGSSGTGVTASCESPEVIMKGLDWCNSSEAWYLMEWGTYEMGNYTLKDGYPMQNDEQFMNAEWWGGENLMQNVTDKGFWWWKSFGSYSQAHVPYWDVPWTAQNAGHYIAEKVNQEEGLAIVTPVVNRVKTKLGGLIEKYEPVQNDIRLQYNARMIIATSDAEFDKAFDEFLSEMNVRGHDQETTAEFNEQYKEYTNTPAGKVEVNATGYMERNVFGTEPMLVGID